MRKTVVSMMIGLLLVSAGVAFGQAQRGTITVTVQDSDGARLPGATVSAESDQTLSSRTGLSNDEGVVSDRRPLLDDSLHHELPSDQYVPGDDDSIGAG